MDRRIVKFLQEFMLDEHHIEMVDGTFQLQCFDHEGMFGNANAFLKANPEITKAIFAQMYGDFLKKMFPGAIDIRISPNRGQNNTGIKISAGYISKQLYELEFDLFNFNITDKEFEKYFNILEALEFVPLQNDKNDSKHVFRINDLMQFNQIMYRLQERLGVIENDQDIAEYIGNEE